MKRLSVSLLTTILFVTVSANSSLAQQNTVLKNRFCQVWPSNYAKLLTVDKAVGYSFPSFGASSAASIIPMAYSIDDIPSWGYGVVDSAETGVLLPGEWWAGGTAVYASADIECGTNANPWPIPSGGFSAGIDETAYLEVDQLAPGTHTVTAFISVTGSVDADTIFPGDEPSISAKITANGKTYSVVAAYDQTAVKHWTVTFTEEGIVKDTIRVVDLTNGYTSPLFDVRLPQLATLSAKVTIGAGVNTGLGDDEQEMDVSGSIIIFDL